MNCRYYLWLFVVSVLTGLCPIIGLGFDSPLCAKLWMHCTLSYAAIVLHRVICVMLFYTLSRSDFDRGIHQDMLEQFSETYHVPNEANCDTDDQECAICYAAYAPGDVCRKLQCRHQFHKHCIDVWVLRHQNVCPLCLAVVGPTVPSESASHGGNFLPQEAGLNLN